MLEIKLFEAISHVNSRGDMGRVVVPPQLPETLDPKEAGKFYFCCNRAFLTAISIANHKKVCDKKTERSHDLSPKAIIRQACSAAEKYSRATVDVTASINRRKSLDGTVTFNCRRCLYGCTNLQELAEHVMTIHNIHFHESKHTTVDNTVYSIRKDAGIISLTLYKCNICNYVTTYKKKIISHEQKTHVDVGSQYPCPHCTCRYGERSELTLHLATFHKKHLIADTNTIAKHDQTSQTLRKKAGGMALAQKRKFDSGSIQLKNSGEKQNGPDLKRTKKTTLHPINSLNDSSFVNCDVCSKLFPDKKQLMIHYQRHISSEKTEDPLEIEYYDAQDTLESHIHEEGDFDIKPFANDKKGMLSGGIKPIEDYGTSPTISNMSEGSVDNFPNNRKCYLCGIVPKNSFELDRHLKVAHVIMGVNCDCGCSFTTATELTHHKNVECPQRKVADADNFGDTRSSLKQIYKCDCGSSFINRRALSKHVTMGLCPSNKINQESSDDNIKDGSLDKSVGIFTQSTGRETLQTPRNTESYNKSESIQCLECKKWFKNDVGLRVHTLKAHSHRLDTWNKFCELCSYRTPNFQLYKYHKITCHVPNGINCPGVNCNCSFKTIEGLSIHFKFMHKGTLERSQLELKCSQCDFTTFKSALMDRHELKGHTTKEIVEKIEKIYNCEQCAFTSAFPKALKLHMMANHVENGFQCLHCNNSFNSENGMRKHSFLMHKTNTLGINPEDYSICKLCNSHLGGTLKSYKEHYERCHVGPVKCSECVCSFKHVDGLSRHMQAKHNKKLDKTAYQSEASEDYSICKLCNAHTGSQNGYKEHYQRCHVGPVKCSECVCSFKHIEGLSRHMRAKHNKKLDKAMFLLKCNHSDCTFSTLFPGSLKHHETVAHSTRESSTDDHSKFVTCHICNANIKNLEDHISRAHVQDGFSCPENCKCSFRTQAGLSVHMYQKHGKRISFKTTKTEKCRSRDPLQNPVECTDCDFRCKDQHSLNIHSSKKHGFSIQLPKMKKKHVCEICHRETPGTLSSHKKRCHVPNGFKCLRPDCPCSFETHSSRAHHMVKAHQMIASKECQICKFKFYGTVQNHMKKCHVPNGVKCEYCRCCFESETSMLMHMRKRHNHTLPKKTKECDLCGFKVLETMNSHIARCHVVNGVKCEYEDCRCSFESVTAMLMHMRRRHNHSLPKKTKECDLCGHKVLETMNSHIARCHVVNGVKCEHEDCRCSFESETSMHIHMRIRHPEIKVARICSLCGNSVKTMSLHVARCHVINGLPCSFCSCSFKTEAGRIMHMQMRHNIKMSTNCTICGIIPVVSMNKHMEQSHVAGGHSCSHCECSFRTERIRRRHLERYHNVTTDPKQCSLCKMGIRITMSAHLRNHHVPNGFKCKYCPWSLRNKLGLNIHMYKLHKRQIGNTIDDSTNPQEISKGRTDKQFSKRIIETCNKPPSIKIFKCSFCCKDFKNNLERSRHIIRFHKNNGLNKFIEKKISEKETKLTPKPIAIPLILSVPISAKPSSPTFKTPKCPQISWKKAGRSTHARVSHTHVEQKGQPSDGNDSRKESIACPTAEKVFQKGKEESSLLPKEKLTCPKCGYLAASKSHLNMHLQKSHVKNSPFRCNYCPCSYATEKELFRHKKIFHAKNIF